MNAAAAKKKPETLTEVALPIGESDGAPVVERFTVVHLARWGAWLLSRLQRNWPHMTQWSYAGLLGNHTRSNESLLIKTQKAVMLAVLTQETFEQHPIVDIVFLYKFYPVDTEGNKWVRPLIREAKEWGRAKRASYIRLEQIDHTDLNATQTREIIGGGEIAVCFVDLNKK